MEIKPEVLDELLKGVKTQQDLMGPNGLLKGKLPAALSITHNSQAPDRADGPWKEAPSLRPLVPPIQ